MSYAKKILLTSLLLLPFPAMAQSGSDAMLINKIERLEREILTLQHDLYSGSRGQRPVQAAPVPTVQDSSQVSALEEQVRQLTGRIEQLEHQNKQTAEKLDAFIAQQYEASSVPPQAQPPVQQQVQQTRQEPVRVPPAAQQEPLPSPFTAVPLDEPLPPSVAEPKTPAPAPAEAPAPVADQTGDPAQQLYEQSFTYLRQANYVEAENGFKKFIESYADHNLASNAYYWLGETYFVQKDYEQSAVQFLRGYKKFPQGNKAPDSLLKLGVSLASLGKEKEACTSLDKLFTEFPQAPNAITQRAREEAERYKCG